MSELCSFPDFRRIMEDINRKEKLFLNYVPVYIVLPLVSKTKTKTFFFYQKKEQNIFGILLYILLEQSILYIMQLTRIY